MSSGELKKPKPHQQKLLDEHPRALAYYERTGHLPRALDMARKEERAVARKVFKQLTGWRVVAKYASDSSPGRYHTVETDDRGGFRCTCIAFKARKAHCWHVKSAALEGK